jgi:chemotaxis response regulator CheB
MPQHGHDPSAEARGDALDDAEGARPAKRVGGRDIVVIGASAGGWAALRTLFSSCPADLPAAVFVVVHRAPSVLPWAFGDSSGALGIHPDRCAVADNGRPIARNRIYLAPADRNMLLERGRIRLEESPREHLNRPGINTLFRSAALAYGRRVIGVILTGNLEDGTAGLWEIKRRGGIAIVQDPDEAEAKGMPRSALANVAVDYCVTLREIGTLLGTLTARKPSPPPVRGSRPADVLIVEDEAIVALNLKRRLEELGYHVCASVGTGEEAVAAAGSSEPDLVLMDIRLPGAIDGTEAARAIWERYQVPVIYVTAYADEETLDKVKTTEAYGYVVKPFNPAEVHAVIQLALERRERELNEFAPGQP